MKRKYILCLWLVLPLMSSYCYAGLERSVKCDMLMKMRGLEVYPSDPEEANCGEFSRELSIYYNGVSLDFELDGWLHSVSYFDLISLGEVYVLVTKPNRYYMIDVIQMDADKELVLSSVGISSVDNSFSISVEKNVNLYVSVNRPDLDSDYAFCTPMIADQYLITVSSNGLELSNPTSLNLNDCSHG